MAPFSRLIRFESDGKKYFADLGIDTTEPPSAGKSVTAYPSLEDLTIGKNEVTVAVGKVACVIIDARDSFANEFGHQQALGPGSR
jgi:hypothetical protein